MCPRRRTEQVLRAGALLMAADGRANTRIAEEIGVTPVTVRSWRQPIQRGWAAQAGAGAHGPRPQTDDHQRAGRPDRAAVAR